MISAGIAIGIGTISSFSLRNAFSTPPYPKQKLHTKLAGLEFVLGGKNTIFKTSIYFTVFNISAA